MSLPIEEVYRILSQERDYQDEIHKDIPELYGDANHSVSDWIIFMERLINDAKDKIYDLDEEEAMKFVKKATAVGVAAMQHKGVKPREGV